MKTDIIGRTFIAINAPIAKVWGALTTPALIKEYFFGTNTKTDWQVGSPITFEGEYQGKKYHDKGTVKEFIPNKRLKYSYWSSMSGIEDKPENYADITYDLKEAGHKTELTVTQENIPDEKMREHSEENWKRVMTGLKAMVENN